MPPWSIAAGWSGARKAVTGLGESERPAPVEASSTAEAPMVVIASHIMTPPTGMDFKKVGFPA